MNDIEIRAPFIQLLQICTAFATTAAHGADIRDYGLTPELLTTCQRALAVWHEHVPSSDVGHAGEESAAWHAYTQMLADHGDDF